MGQSEMTLDALWRLVEESNRLTRTGVTDALAEVRARLGEMVTKEVWEAERRELERRLDRAEVELAEQARRQQALQERLDIQARQAAETLLLAQEERSRRRRDFYYKGVLPLLGLLITAAGLFVGLH